MRRLNRARGVVAVSRAVQGVLRGVGVVAPICVVHDGIEPLPTPREGARARVRQRLGLREDESLVVAVGALVDHKGHRIVVRALSQLPRTHLAICGRGPLRRSLLRLAGHEGVGDRLHLPGHVGDVSDWLAAADVFCHPSLEEGLGQAVIEALVHGVPVVASRAGGLPETVQGHGTLVPPGDPGALAAALRQTLVGGAGCPDAHRAKLLERFGTEAMVRGTEQAYRTFLEGAR
ncbi:MAG: glycosyltransferase [Myxococcales bacterium]|nr:glycosyltransferase [Myxococcales bacterium]